MKRLALAAVLLAVLAIAFVAGLAVAQPAPDPEPEGPTLEIKFGSTVSLEKEDVAKAEWVSFATYIKEQNIGTVGAFQSGADSAARRRAKGELGAKSGCGATAIVNAGRDSAKLGALFLKLDDTMRSVNEKTGGKSYIYIRMHYPDSGKWE